MTPALKTSMTKKDAVGEELKQILASDPDGLIRAEAVVEFARDPSTALHGKFEWDDEVAAHQRRLDVARGIVRSYYVVLTKERPQKYRAYLSLTSDRQRQGGGYRSTARILSDAGMRAQLLADAFAEMKNFMAKYERLQELSEVFAAMEAAMKPRGG